MTPDTPLIRLRAQSFRTVVLALFALIVITAIQIGAPHWLGQEPGAIDYKIFHYVGELSSAGQPALPYDAPAFEAWQKTKPGGDIFMPWTYPPQFGLFTQVLSRVPVGIGYALFTGLTLAMLIWTLTRLAPGHAIPAVMLTLPAILMNIRAGQNGFLTALLFALTFLLVLRNRPASAGVPLGLLAFKPHLGLGIGLVALFRGGWRMVFTAVFVLVGSLTLATWVYGVEIWQAFLTSVHDSGNFLRHGAYPMERMTSLYALLRSLGAPGGFALAAQALLAATLLGTIIIALIKRWQMPHLLALSIFAGLGISPYGYDYDLVALAPGLALALPTLSAHTTGAARPILIAALLLATGWGLLTVLLSGPLALSQPPALGALGYLVTLALSLRALFLAEGHGTA
ncbi:glycosyltransferase family 87 protein [Alisedimentitalea sp. MJ-SS2]|uniref:glycosyltransferase family 87 protein n=1 Tax=Aliisedimentitalea sp. MJ-SS2 TaxID=3049795 RepID=UPI00290BB859|nr:glycosyltransferase family 87 protein [Alisedimentitalea sp. MJ-SS2]MDU8926778.1 glycosyltransferase family 87 protein [Alisedimentitalea sp. MJ-SS2]